MNRGRWIILDLIAAGSVSLLQQLRTWLTVADRTGRERSSAIAGRAAGVFACAWFVGGVLYALGALWWGAATLWLISSIVAGRRIDENPSPTAPSAPLDDEKAGHGGEFTRTEVGGGGVVILRDTAEDRHNKVVQR